MLSETAYCSVSADSCSGFSWKVTKRYATQRRSDKLKFYFGLSGGASSNIADIANFHSDEEIYVTFNKVLLQFGFLIL